MGEFTKWMMYTYTQRWHAHYHTSGTGHLYQGRFKSFPVQDNVHLLLVLRYVQRNALRGKRPVNCTPGRNWVTTRRTRVAGSRQCSMRW